MHSCESLDEKRKNRDPPIREAAATIETSIHQQKLDSKFKVSKVVWYVASKSKENCSVQRCVKIKTKDESKC